MYSVMYRIFIHMALTDIQIKCAKPQDKAYTLNDGQGLSTLIARKAGAFVSALQVRLG
ncbi:hypothetical protein OOA_15892 [Providencia burhodogranariea DSM 19968]|uniref:Uncharacterized protein n=1 Tax=Providencia burhodogranariea DSM 19968 TaxID=1141662 RepID=K8W6C2_9GAMM|nr:hypothetical protein OOA_15892 [Providencia burhodogranariea DSM 19968]